MSGAVSLSFDTISTSQPTLTEWLRGIAVSSGERCRVAAVPDRAAVLPRFPTVTESGIPGFRMYPWFRWFAPAGTPAVVLERPDRRINKVLSNADYQQRGSVADIEYADGSVVVWSSGGPSNMSAIAPLQVLIFRHAADTDVAPFEEAIVRAFQGGKDAAGYLASGEDLGIQLAVFSAAPVRRVADALDAFCHTLTVVLLDHSLLNAAGDDLWDWLAECWRHTNGSAGRHAMLAIPMDERISRGFSNKRPPLDTLQLLQVSSLGEPAIRPAVLALRMLHECRLLLAAALPAPGGASRGFLRLFISHAKIDGLPLARALKYQIKSIGWLKAFYDVDDLPAGCNWQQELERGVGASLIVILRSDVYDSRYWCQQEVLWADEYATPAVLVDARTKLTYPSGVLPLERIPAVRIPDGNLLRILFVALREGVRFLIFMRQVEAMKQRGDLPSPVELRVFSFPPSMSALLRACRSIATAASAAGTTQFILYPDPPLRAGLYEAALALVSTHAPGARLVTPDTLAATKGTGP